jgi:peptide deformylase
MIGYLMQIKLLEEGNELLTNACEEWDFEKDGDPTELVKDLFTALVEYGGVGLAAPQCGIMKNIFVMGNFQKLTACINPVVVETSDNAIVDVEGCLSFPGLWLKVKRPTSVTVQYQNIEGKTVQEELDGLAARVFLHEFDHLFGITFDNRVGELSLKMAREKRKKSIKKLSRASASQA